MAKPNRILLDFKTFLQENHLILPSNLNYGCMAGFQDYGVYGLYLKNKLIDLWETILASQINQIYRIETPTLLPYPVLKASGHVDRFTDFVVVTEDQEVHRADHVVKKYFEDHNQPDLADQVSGYSREQLEEAINSNNMLNQTVPLKVTTKNLMFDTDINAESNDDSVNKLLFLRPEIAQGMFIAYNQIKLYAKRDTDFGICQTGKSYRKEVSPVPLTRLREFSQAEIEYFCDPEKKTHRNYKTVSELTIPILTEEMQITRKPVIWITVYEAVQKGMISNELMGFFMGKIFTLAKEIGLKPDLIRFRQHLSNEKAHYSSECWDLECFVDSDWLECVGISDRGDYDLKAHSVTVPLVARRYYLNPVQVTELKLTPNMKRIKECYPENIRMINEFFKNQTQVSLRDLRDELVTTGEIRITPDITINSTHVQINEITITKHYDDYIPHVIEPSIGVDRLLYAVLFQNFYKRTDDEKRMVLSLPKSFRLYDVAIFPLLNKDELWNHVYEIRDSLDNLRCYLDETSVNLGKKYVRADELGVPFAITVDVETLSDNQVTIRERDSMRQIRVAKNEIHKVLQNPESYFAFHKTT